MTSPYPGTPVSGYNANPPPDDGTQVPLNQITWAGIKSKLGDPLNTFAGAVDANLTSAFVKTLDGSAVVRTASNYPATAADQGRLIVATASGITITTPDATVVGTPFIFAVNNQSSSTIFVAGNGVQTVDGSAQQPLASGTGCFLKCDGTNWVTCGLVSAAGFEPQGYLTLVSDVNNVFYTGDVTAATSVFYTPYVGNVIPIYNGSVFQNFTFSQLTLTLNNPNHAANTIYDVFVFLNNGSVTIGTGPAWTTSTPGGAGVRGTGNGTTQLAKTNGLWTNVVQITARNGSSTFTVPATQATYVGSICIDSTVGQISHTVNTGQSRKAGVFNAYNRLPVELQVVDPTASWTYSSTAVRAANSSVANNAQLLIGLNEVEIYAEYTNDVTIASATAGGQANCGIGFNSAIAFSNLQGTLTVTTSNTTIGATITGKYIIPAGASNLGAIQLTACENGNGAAGMTATWHGSNSHMLLYVTYLG